jgi:hypothetical protein
MRRAYEGCDYAYYQAITDEVLGVREVSLGQVSYFVEHQLADTQMAKWALCQPLLCLAIAWFYRAEKVPFMYDHIRALRSIFPTTTILLMSQLVSHFSEPCCNATSKHSVPIQLVQIQHQLGRLRNPRRTFGIAFSRAM